MQNHEPFLAFIVGHSRGATTWMSRCLATHPDVAAFGESMFWGRRYVLPQKDGFYDRDQALGILDRLKGKGIIGHSVGEMKHINPDNISDLIDEAFSDIGKKIRPEDLFLGICRMVLINEKKQWVVEKTPHHLNHLNRIMAALPHAKILIMVREPYGFMLSYKHEAERNLDAGEGTSKRKRAYHPLGCALVWRQYARAALSAMRRYPDTMLLVNFADVLSNPNGVLSRVASFLGLNPEYDIMVSGVGSSFEKRKPLSLASADIFWMNLIGRKEMKEMNVVRRATVGDSVGILMSFLELPVYAARALWEIKQQVEGNLIKYLGGWLGVK